MKFTGKTAVTILLLMILAGCQTGWQGEHRDFRQDMRNLVQAIHGYAEDHSPGFIVIPQNGHALVTTNGEEDGPAATEYLEAIDGIGREDLFYGYNFDDVATPGKDRDSMIPFLDLAEGHGISVIVTDYVSTQAKVDTSYAENNARGYTSFAADSRDLDTIPIYPATPYGTSSNNIAALSDAANFLYLLDPSAYPTKAAYLAALSGTNFDFFILDLFFEDGSGAPESLTASDVAGLRIKSDGGSRLVICYMSIGEAEDYRFYWDSSWDSNPPAWLEDENTEWKGNYKVQYWRSDWQAILFGASDAYLDKIIDAGFDGVYLDIIDAYEYFEG